MDKILPYEYHKYVYATRCTVIACSSLELLIIILGSVGDSNVLAKLIYIFLVGASIAVSAGNIRCHTDGKEEIQKIMYRGFEEQNLKSPVLVALPALSGAFVFLTVSGNAFFSFLALIHVIASFGQLAIEAYEVKISLRIRAPPNKRVTVDPYDSNYQTLNNVHDKIFDKK